MVSSTAPEIPLCGSCQLLDLNLVVAMAVEAAPLVAHYRMQPSKGVAPFPVFTGDGIQLMVSGIGRVNSASAVAWLAAAGQSRCSCPSFDQVWLNLGIAGSSAFNQGDLVVAERVEEAASRRRWRVLPPPAVQNVVSVVTVDCPQTVYDRPAVYEMEASGFLAAARRIGHHQRIQIAKIVSDGPETPVKALNRSSIAAIVERALPQVEKLIERLRLEQNNTDKATPHYSLGEFLQRWCFDVEQLCILHRLLRQARREGVTVEIDELAPAADTYDLLRMLGQRLKG